MDVPKKHLAWLVRGAGLENFGKDGKPEEIETPEPGPGEVLCRVEAVGLCFSDVKLIKAGENHPRIKVDLKENPTIPGHEAMLKVVKAGSEREADYPVGSRWLIQADIFKNGETMAFGYVFRGAMQQYVLVPDPVFTGDEAPYLLPVQEKTGASETALVEPWACVDAAYHIHPRSKLMPGGTMFVTAGENIPENVDFSGMFEFDRPSKIMTDLKGELVKQLDKACQGAGLECERSIPGKKDLVDDVIVIGVPTSQKYTRMHHLLNRGGVLAVVTDSEFELDAKVDLGRIHYQDLQHIGTTTGRVIEAYTRNPRNEIKEDGISWMIGAAGPMGQMHVQRALELDKPPKKIFATDVSDDRLGYLKKTLVPQAEEKGIRLETYNPVTAPSPDVADENTCEAAPDGFDDIVIMAPVVKLIEDSVKFAGPDCVVNVFAGLPVGTEATVPVGKIAGTGLRLLGSSGSSMADIRRVLENMESGKLDTNRSCAAIGGMYAIHDGIRAVQEGTFPGKTVIYPSLLKLPLLPLPELVKKFPSLEDKLGPGGSWTTEAEKELLNQAE